MANTKDLWLKLKDKYFKKDKEEVGTALDRMNGIVKFINFFAFVPGLQFTDNWEINGRTFFAAFVNFVMLSCNIYSICYYFPSRAKDLVVLVAMIAFNTTVWVKLICVSLNHKKFMSLVQYTLAVFESNTSGPRERMLMNATHKIHYHFKVNISGFLGGYVLYSIFPINDLINNGKLTLVSPALLPFVNAEHLRGYLITSGFNMFIVSYCLTICIAVSSLFFAFVDVYNGLVSLVEYDFEMFDATCGKKEVRNVMMQLMDLVRFKSYINHLFNVISTVQVAASCAVVVCSTAGYMAFDYMNCLGGALSFYTEMSMYCYIGQILDNTNKRIIRVICNAQWYTYEVKYQKDMMIALYIAQNVKPICLGDLFPLNFDTGLKITKNIYTLVMFMLEMFG